MVGLSFTGVFGFNRCRIDFGLEQFHKFKSRIVHFFDVDAGNNFCEKKLQFGRDARQMGGTRGLCVYGGGDGAFRNTFLRSIHKLNKKILQ